MTASALGAVLAALLAGEVLTRWGSRVGFTAGGARCGGEAVLVLGCPSRRGGRVSAMQRWRVRIAVRSARSSGTTFVFSGGSRTGASEAAVMADHARRVHGISPERARLEERSRSTWENVAFSIPLLEGASTIRIASNTFHARRARRYLRQQWPAGAERLRPARDWIPGELMPLKPFLVLYELRRGRHARRRR